VFHICLTQQACAASRCPWLLLLTDLSCHLSGINVAKLSFTGIAFDRNAFVAVICTLNETSFEFHLMWQHLPCPYFPFTKKLLQ
jgi:hypothetical protein